MGLLDKWSKKQEKEQLGAVEGKTADVSSTTKKVTKTKKVSEEVKKGASVKGNANSVIIKPLVSEKSAHAEVSGKYTFLVNKQANKTEIKKAVKQIYGVMPVEVRVMNFEGKRTRFGAMLGKRKDFKKAIVTLKKGNTISIHEGV